MATPEQEEALRFAANEISELLEAIYGQKMGFILNIAPFGADNNISDYIGNCDRSTAVNWMLETSQRFMADEVIPAAEGEG